MRPRLMIIPGRTTCLAARVHSGGSGGTAFPGLAVERTNPGFLERTLDRLLHGVIVASGINGETTTTKIVVQLLREQNLKVLTNRTGLDFVCGVLASLLTGVDATGDLDANIAALELDEARAVHFVARTHSCACLLLNVMRDQLSHFGEIGHTASLLRSVAQATSDVIALSGDDSRPAVPVFLEGVGARVIFFGAGEDLRSLFLLDDDLRTGLVSPCQASQAPGPRVTLEVINDQHTTVRVDGIFHEVGFVIPGVHNLPNACTALGAVLEVLGEDVSLPGLLTTLGTMQVVFGRGEVLTLDGRPVRLPLVRSPAGFRMGLLPAASWAQDGKVVVMIINDGCADGRDIPWPWDVDFLALRAGGVAIATGVRARDIALRLYCDEVEVVEVGPDLHRAVASMRRAVIGIDRPTWIFTIYTTMLALYSILDEMTDVEGVM